MTFEMGTDTKIPVLNAKGVAAHPYAPLEVGMLVNQRNRNGMAQPDHVRKSAFVFNWFREFHFIELEDDMIDWVDDSPWLKKPIFMFHMDLPDYGEPLLRNAIKDVPIQHALRRCDGYKGMIYTIEDFGDIHGNFKESVTTSRANFLNKVKENIPDFQFPTSNYISPTVWREVSHLIVNEYGNLVETVVREPVERT